MRLIVAAKADEILLIRTKFGTNMVNLDSGPIGSRNFPASVTSRVLKNFNVNQPQCGSMLEFLEFSIFTNLNVGIFNVGIFNVGRQWLVGVAAYLLKYIIKYLYIIFMFGLMNRDP